MTKDNKKPLLQIAVDGPVSAGKSTLCDALAKRLGILHLDTGAMYRAIGLFALDHGIAPDDEAQLEAALAAGKAKVSVAFVDGLQATLLNGVDVSLRLRGEQVGAAASTVSLFPAVRRYLVHLQQQLATQQSILIDGRDIGTVVLPKAPVKIFLTASPEARALRRYTQLISAGQNVDYATVLKDLTARDEQDIGRACDPLRQAEDAVVLDTSTFSFEESLEKMYAIVKVRYDL